MSNEKLSIKRIYDQPAPEDGYRVLVDRLWPRGVSKERANLGVWLKEIAPSAGLCAWFGHDPARFAEFRDRYRSELDGNPALEELRATIAEHAYVTLLYGARDQEHNQAVVLKAYLDED